MSTDPKEDLMGCLRHGREAVVWKLEGLGERDVRRPMTPTGTSLLGLVKHLATVESGYLGEVFDRPFPEPLGWVDEVAEDGRRAGHADVLREMIDGRAGRHPGASDLPERDDASWATYRERLQTVADGF